ncbi:S8 family serine peptidase [Engelhardtia mirabilis]|uniref:Thermitase n=1 Tax=Engelhardtia mirabilis TaxID=2528011 RepID=A0A518BR51_9BACT|nr:Thermitase [Planctomycetes bacterium Pla133]QDV03765.1 Thermitase [Planctomycetes bacterium Pla86]
MQRPPRVKSLFTIACLTLSASPLVAQEIPTRAFVPTQDGIAAPARDLTLYRPGRVLIQVTREAVAASLLDRSWRGGEMQPFAGSGLIDLDAELFVAGASGITRSLIDTADVERGQELGMDRWYAVDVPAGTDIEALAARLVGLAVIEDASPDWRAFPADVPNDPLHASHWGHNNTGQMLSYCWGCGGHAGGSPVGTAGFDTSAEAAWDGAQGYGSASVVIAIIDSGVDAGHPDLRQVAGWDYGDGDSNADDNSAAPGHGTACAGVAAAINDNNLGTAGIAGGCSIMPLKVANSAGSMFFSAIANAVTHAADNGASVASLSLGAAISNDSQTSSAISYANSQGVTILAATANGNQSSLEYPANNALVIGVGAASPCGERKRSSSSTSELNPGVAADPNGYTCDGERWWGSNYGTNTQDAAGAVDVIAPTILPTTDIQGSGGYDSGNYSQWFNGTSCSTPYAAGVCALIQSANPSFTPVQVRAQLVSTCDDVTSVESGAGWDRYTGYGMVNAAAAVGSGGGGPGPGATYASLPYSTGFEATSLDASWTTVLGAEGRIQVTTANGPFAGARHLTMDDTIDAGAYSLNEARLHLDLSGESQVDLDFQWKEFGDETHAEDGVYFSSNGGSSFVKVHDLNGGSTTDNTWQAVSLDLDALAAGAGLTLTSTFVVKFQQYDNYAIATDGFAFDEVSVAAGSTGGGGGSYATLPYSTGFESGALDSNWVTTEGTEGRILVTTANAPYAGSWHLTMDDSVDAGAYSQNEAWMRLDLSGESQVDLSFRWKEFGDETHAEDGVYFSSNGGTSFTKVHDLNGGSTTNNSWQLVSLDLDALAAGAGLSLSSTFVVKFQQYDNYAIATDGFAFDEVSVTAGSGGGGNPNRAQVGYSTGFETGALDSFWTTTSSPEGRILVTTANGPSAGSWHLTMDDSVDGSLYGQNEAWLLCDFTGQSQVGLTFRWKDFADETHTQDGVFLSDDGGASFTKVYNLNGGSFADNTWQTINVDIDALAGSNGLSLNGNFVIKFQQYDNYAATTDGFAFDDIALN